MRTVGLSDFFFILISFLFHNLILNRLNSALYYLVPFVGVICFEL